VADRLLFWRRHKVDQLFHPAQKHRLQVGVGIHAAQNSLPRPRDVGLVSVRPAQCFTDTVFPLDGARNCRPRFYSDSRWLHRLPDVDERMSDYQDGRAIGSARDSVCNSTLFGVGHQMVYENANLAPWTRLKVLDDRIQIVHALEVLHHNALDPEVVSPHTLHEFGVMSSLNKNAAGQRNTCPGIGDGEGSGRRARGRTGLRPRGAQRDRLSIDQKPGAEREQAYSSVSVLELDKSVFDTHNRTHKARGDLFNHEVTVGLHNCRRDFGSPSGKARKHV